MITAQKSPLFERVFDIYNNNLITRRFNSLRVDGLSNLENKSNEVPLVVYLNHSSWWDGLIAFKLSKRLRLDSFFMMEEKHLKKLFLFRRLGAFSVVREKPRRAVESLNYAVELLAEKPARALWIFPQGEILPNDARPLRFYNGLSRVTGKLTQAQVLPIALRFEFLNAHKPDVFVKIGAIEHCGDGANKFDSKIATENFADKLTFNLDELKNDIRVGNLADFENII